MQVTIRMPFETVNAFPSAFALRNVSLVDLRNIRNIKVGYRDKYLLSAIEKISNGSISLTDQHKGIFNNE